jgi:hypothetical protein
MRDLYPEFQREAADLAGNFERFDDIWSGRSADDMSLERMDSAR